MKKIVDYYKWELKKIDLDSKFINGLTCKQVELDNNMKDSIVKALEERSKFHKFLESNSEIKSLLEEKTSTELQIALCKQIAKPLDLTDDLE